MVLKNVSVNQDQSPNYPGMAIGASGCMSRVGFEVKFLKNFTVTASAGTNKVAWRVWARFQHTFSFCEAVLEGNGTKVTGEAETGEGKKSPLTVGQYNQCSLFGCVGYVTVQENANYNNKLGVDV